MSLLIDALKRAEQEKHKAQQKQKEESLHVKDHATSDLQKQKPQTEKKADSLLRSENQQHETLTTKTDSNITDENCLSLEQHADFLDKDKNVSAEEALHALTKEEHQSLSKLLVSSTSDKLLATTIEQPRESESEEETLYYEKTDAISANLLANELAHMENFIPVSADTEFHVRSIPKKKSKKNIKQHLSIFLIASGMIAIGITSYLFWEEKTKSNLSIIQKNITPKDTSNIETSISPWEEVHLTKTERASVLEDNHVLIPLPEEKTLSIEEDIVETDLHRDVTDTLMKIDGTNIEKDITLIQPSTPLKKEENISSAEAEHTSSLATSQQTNSKKPIQQNINPPIRKIKKHSDGKLTIKKNTTEASVATFNDTLNRAYQSYQQGNLDISENLYQRLYKNFPDNRDVLFGLGAINQKKKNTAQAKWFFTQLLRYFPNDASTLVTLSTLNSSSNKALEESIQTLISQYPNQPIFYKHLGAIQAEQKKWDESLLAFKRAYALFPDADNTYNLAVIHDQKGDLANAYLFYQEALALINQSNFSFDPQSIHKRLEVIHKNSEFIQ